MKLRTCSACGHKISKTAKTCPSCGHEQRRTRLITWLIAIVFVPAIFLGIFQGATSPPPAATKTAEQRAADVKADELVERARAGAVALKRATRNPARFSLESAVVVDQTEAVCYEYRAENGFGGLDVGHAVLLKDGAFRTDGMDEFSASWREACADRSGRELAAALNLFGL